MDDNLDGGVLNSKITSLESRPFIGRPSYKLSVNLIDTYKNINRIYYEEKARRLNEQADVTRGGVHNDGFDDANYDYIVIENEVIQDQYILKQRVGKGSFGQVVNAYDRTNKREVAVKIIKSKRPFFVQAQTEIELLRRIKSFDTEGDSHNIVQLLDTFVHKKHQCIVFEMLSYNLYELLSSTKFKGISLTLVRKFSSQILIALQYLASPAVDIVHCDLKPENILLRHPKHSAVKIIDFGSSCLRLAPAYTYIQSRFYRSPEILLGMPYDQRIDMWSLGCLLAEMHIGQPLFSGSDQEDQVCRIIDVLGMPDAQFLEDAPEKKFKYFDRIELDSNRDLQTPYVSDTCDLSRRSELTDHSAVYVLKRPARKDMPKPRSLAEILGVYMGGPPGRQRGDEHHSEERYLEFLDFIQSMLVFDPKGRISAEAALRHPYITNNLPNSLHGSGLSQGSSYTYMNTSHVTGSTAALPAFPHASTAPTSAENSDVSNNASINNLLNNASFLNKSVSSSSSNPLKRNSDSQTKELKKTSSKYNVNNNNNAAVGSQQQHYSGNNQALDIVNTSDVSVGHMSDVFDMEYISCNDSTLDALIGSTSHPNLNTATNDSPQDEGNEDNPQQSNSRARLYSPRHDDSTTLAVGSDRITRSAQAYLPDQTISQPAYSEQNNNNDNINSTSDYLQRLDRLLAMPPEISRRRSYSDPTAVRSSSSSNYYNIGDIFNISNYWPQSLFSTRNTTAGSNNSSSSAHPSAPQPDLLPRNMGENDPMNKNFSINTNVYTMNPLSHVHVEGQEITNISAGTSAKGIASGSGSGSGSNHPDPQRSRNNAPFNYYETVNESPSQALQRQVQKLQLYHQTTALNLSGQLIVENNDTVSRYQMDNNDDVSAVNNIMVTLGQTQGNLILDDLNVFNNDYYNEVNYYEPYTSTAANDNVLTDGDTIKYTVDNDDVVSDRNIVINISDTSYAASSSGKRVLDYDLSDSTTITTNQLYTDTENNRNSSLTNLLNASSGTNPNLYNINMNSALNEDAPNCNIVNISEMKRSHFSVNTSSSSNSRHDLSTSSTSHVIAPDLESNIFDHLGHRPSLD